MKTFYNFNCWLYYKLVVQVCNFKLFWLDLYIEYLERSQAKRYARLAELEKEIAERKNRP
jgi:hypothetical protein